jgi:1,4-dihydroxy-2-naphthoate octaprenyltransferase
MKWFKDNWLLLLIVLVAIIIFLATRTRMNEYRGDIKAKDAFIEKLMSEYQTLEDSASVVKKQVEVYENQVLSYQDNNIL